MTDRDNPEGITPLMSWYDPMPTPSVGIFDEPNEPFLVNVQWRGIILGVVSLLINDMSWVAGTEEQAEFTRQQLLLFLAGRGDNDVYSLQLAEGCLIQLLRGALIVSEIDVSTCAITAGNQAVEIEAHGSDGLGDGFGQDTLNEFSPVDTGANSGAHCSSAELAADYVISSAGSFLDTLDALGDSLNEYIDGLTQGMDGNWKARMVERATILFNFVTSIGAGLISASLGDPDTKDSIKCYFYCVLESREGVWDGAAMNQWRSMLRQENLGEQFIALATSTIVSLGAILLNVPSAITYQGIAQRIQEGADGDSQNCDGCTCGSGLGWEKDLYVLSQSAIKYKIQDRYFFSSGSYDAAGMYLKAPSGTPLELVLPQANRYRGVSEIRIGITSNVPFALKSIHIYGGHYNGNNIGNSDQDFLYREILIDGKVVFESEDRSANGDWSYAGTESVYVKSVEITWREEFIYHTDSGSQEGNTDYGLTIPRLYLSADIGDEPDIFEEA